MRGAVVCAVFACLAFLLWASSSASAGRRTLSCRDGTSGAIVIGERTLGECDTDGEVDGRCTFSFPDVSRRPCVPLVDCPGPALVSLPVGERRGIPIKAGPFTLRCVPAEPQQTTVCGPELICSTATEICVERGPVGPAVIYSCEPVPLGCESDRSCACAAASLCQPPFDTCGDVGPNTIFCDCPMCQ